MRKLFYWLIAGIAFAFSSCTGDHLIGDNNYRINVEKDFIDRKDIFSKSSEDLFSPFQNNLSTEQKEALQFLYAYMPLSDLADYSGNFFLTNTDLALTTRQESRFGEKIPWDIFLHYVLPLRVNNENLDSFRIKYSGEIASRIKGLDGLKAALEINYWCHEKVAYQPADIRTSGPVSTILSARGRCGEESTFTVAALRAAGIPARQVYTPRWAHSDDNHAWVEFWTGGIWYYMGACEPEPVPDRGWFTEPARRAMLIHTKSFGAATGNENSIVRFRNYSLINNLSKYAVTKNLVVRVTDSYNRLVKDANVEFQLYNYAEFYPLADVPSDENGISRFETGLGDLMVWAHKADQFGYKKISVSETDTLEIVLGMQPLETGYIEYDLGVPVLRKPFSGPSEDLIKANNDRLQKGGSLRKAYIDSWMKPGEAVALAKDTGTDSTVVKDIIKRSMGNFRTIASFIRDTPGEDRGLAIRLLNLISDKDLRDTREDVLTDHLKNTLRYENSGLKYNEDIWYNYVLNPRIANELIVCWRKYLFESIPVNQRQEMISDPEKIVSYITTSIGIMENENYYLTPITPVGLDKLKFSDSFSRDIYFVALCRSLGTPARLEPGTNRPQYFSDNKWNDVWFNGKPETNVQKGYIKLVSDEINPVPEYYIHFTLARFSNGRYNTLEYDFNKKISDFHDELELDPGYYMLMTGNRVNDSRILSSLTFFELKGNEHKTVAVKLRKENSAVENLGTLSLDNHITLSDGRSVMLKELVKEGLVLCWIEPDREPTRHIFSDLPLLKKELDSWGGSFLFLTDPSKPGSGFDQSSVTGLPQRSYFGTDNGSALLTKICGGVSCSTVRLPLIIMTDKEGNVLLKSEGYRIGIGEQILKKAR
jgi:transglutaminase-like putative cysteine protease